MSISRKEARSIVRKAVKRVPEGEEIRHLNIMPMMDIMTILLVAFVFQAAVASAFSVGAVELPAAKSLDPPPEDAVKVTISKGAILVDGRPVVTVRNGDVDSSEKKAGALGIAVPKLTRYLGLARGLFTEELKKQGKTVQTQPELLIIADKATPYRLLMQVIVSSRSGEAGYRRFRLIVLEEKQLIK